MGCINSWKTISDFGAVRNLISGLITLARQGYKIHNLFSENCYWLVIGDSKKKAFVQAYPTF